MATEKYIIKGGDRYTSYYCGTEIPVECEPQELETVGYAICNGHDDWVWCCALQNGVKVKSFRDCM